MSLSMETKLLINKGVFSLYSLAEKPTTDAEFVLYTDSHTFLLSHRGEVIQQLDKNKRFKAIKSITFPEIATPSIALGKYNIA